MRRMEQAADALYKQKMIRGFCHLAIGQEAVSVGMESAIDREDKVITAYRCHTFAVMRGGTIKGVLAELMGGCTILRYRQTGYCAAGRDAVGSADVWIMFRSTRWNVEWERRIDAYLYSLLLWWEWDCWCPSGLSRYYRYEIPITLTQVPVGAGIALAQKYLKKSTVTFALYGDGASNQGQVFESYNMVSARYPSAASKLIPPFRLNYGTFLVYSSARTTNTAWAHPPSDLLKTHHSSLEAIRFQVFRSTGWTSLR